MGSGVDDPPFPEGIQNTRPNAINMYTHLVVSSLEWALLSGVRCGVGGEMSKLGIQCVSNWGTEVADSIVV
jgi:hypothetical protein